MKMNVGEFMYMNDLCCYTNCVHLLVLMGVQVYLSLSPCVVMMPINYRQLFTLLRLRMTSFDSFPPMYYHHMVVRHIGIFTANTSWYLRYIHTVVWTNLFYICRQ
jgi:hypothetical protein